MRIAIIGAGAQEKHFDIKKYDEVWCLNRILFDWIPGCTRMFNIHPYERLKEYGYNVVADSDWAIGKPEIPFYVTDPWPEGFLPNQKIFPRNELEKMPRGDYHCGSFDWLVSFAVYEGATEMGLHGISLCLEGGEPISARSCLEYWCGYAEGNGIKVTTAQDCDLFFFYHLVKSKLVYGYDDTPIFEDRTKIGIPYQLGQARTAAIRRRSA